MSSVTEAITSALGKQGEMLLGAPDWQFAFIRMGVAPCFGLKAERVGEESLRMYCQWDRAGVPVVSDCELKGIVG
ncbi:MAG: hypothetical protein DMG40_27595 [Acidobacteria bacterium]|nr:MAG: hypothetical protein DMG40_27595 [Acidobacteriota bacterium]